MKKTNLLKAVAIGMTMLLLGGCGTAAKDTTVADTTAVTTEVSSEAVTAAETTTAETSGADQEEVTILVAAAASLKYAYDEELIQLFQDQYPWIKVEGTYDSSGKLQTQIEEGLEADVFMSAAVKQMDALKAESLVDADSIVDLLENKIVLIVPADSDSKVTSFDDIINADNVAIGDPESVPAGQYAKTVLTNLGTWDEVEAKSSKGTNVTEVLNWVAEGSADVGIVYATDAATTEKVKVIAEAPESSLDSKVIYPIGIVTASEKQEAATLFVEFLQSKEASAVFEAYGFTPVK